MSEMRLRSERHHVPSAVGSIVAALMFLLDVLSLALLVRSLLIEHCHYCGTMFLKPSGSE